MIVYTSDRNNFPSIYTIDPEKGGEPTALTQNSYNYQPDWSPDGASIAFVSTRIMGPPKVFTMPALGEIAEGGARAREFSRGSEFAYTNPKYSPDGEYLMFMKSIYPPKQGTFSELVGSKIADIGIKEFTIGTYQTVGPIKESDFSPDGNWIVFESWPGFIHDIWMMSANGSDLRQITQDEALDIDAAWRP
jgi:Tol biopolymer transport system component